MALNRFYTWSNYRSDAKIVEFKAMDPNRDPDIETKKYIFFLLISILKGYVAIIYLIVRKYMKQ